MDPISAGIGLASVGARLWGASEDRDAARDAAVEAGIQRDRDRVLQKEFAQQGIRWRVEDAKAAGIHPLYALGAQTTSYSPSTIGVGSAYTGMSEAMGEAGQDLSRAINATRTSGERDDAFTKSVQALTIQKMGLENEVLGSQLAKLRQNLNPPMPSSVPEASKFEDRPKLMVGGTPWPTDPGTVNTEDLTKRYGESADWWGGPMVIYRDLRHNYGDHSSWGPQFMRRYVDPEYGTYRGSRGVTGSW